MTKLDASLITPLPASDSGSAAVWGSKRINPRPQSCLCLTCSGYPSNDDDDECYLKIIQMPKRKSDSERKCVSKVRHYSKDYLKFGFTEEHRNESKPFCLLCNNSLCNDSIRPGELAEIMLLKNAHPEHADKSFEYFKRLKDSMQKTQRSFIKMFKGYDDKKQQLLKASYKLSFLIAKKSRPHTDGEQLLKSAIETYLRTVQGNSRVYQELEAFTSKQRYSSSSFRCNCK